MRSWLERAGFDPRFTSLVLALAAIWIALAVVTDGIFLSPRNLYNLSIQTCVTALMACGMVVAGSAHAQSKAQAEEMENGR